MALTPPSPPYVHRILDAYLTGDLLDFEGLEVPDDVQVRLERAFDYAAQAERLGRGAREVAARGWVKPGEVVLCDVCGERCYVWELHHLLPVAWGGSDSRLVADHQRIWVVADGRCHDTIHMILDRAKKDGVWPDLWINQHGGIPHLIVQAALRGWALWIESRKEEPDGP